MMGREEGRVRRFVEKWIFLTSDAKSLADALDKLQLAEDERMQR